MKEASQNDVALAGREDEGGSATAASRNPDLHEQAPCFPRLPHGHEAQPAWRFHDRTGRFSYEFNRVYGFPEPLDGRGLVGRLEEHLSYWSVTWAARGEDADGHPAGRWITYPQARTLSGHRLTFERFSSLEGMREELPKLLHVGDVAWEPRSAASLSSAADLSSAHDKPKRRWESAREPLGAAAVVRGEVELETEDRLRGGAAG